MFEKDNHCTFPIGLEESCVCNYNVLNIQGYDIKDFLSKQLNPIPLILEI